MTLLLQGVMPNSTLLQQAGISSTEANALKTANTPQVVYKTKDDDGDDPKPKSKDADETDTVNTAINRNPAVEEINTKPQEKSEVSNRAIEIAKQLDSMSGQMSFSSSVGNTIAIYVDTENLSDADARWLFERYGEDPDEWLE